MSDNDNKDLEINQSFDESGFKSLVQSVEQADRENNPDFDPDAKAEEEKKKADAEAQAERDQAQAMEAGAYLAITNYEQLMRMVGHKRFKLDDDLKTEAVEKYGPVIAKYAPSAMVFAGKWKSEIMAAYFTMQLGSASIAQIKQLKAEDRAAAERRKQAQRNQPQQNPNPQNKQSAVKG